MSLNTKSYSDSGNWSCSPIILAKWRADNFNILLKQTFNNYTAVAAFCYFQLGYVNTISGNARMLSYSNYDQIQSKIQRKMLDDSKLSKDSKEMLMPNN